MRVLVISEAPELIEGLRTALQPVAHEVRLEECSQLARAGLRENPPDVLVVDLRNPALAADDVLAAAEAGRLTVPLVIVPRCEFTSELRSALRRGAADYLRLPLVPEEALFRVLGAARRSCRRRDA
jgi:DNA-binding response OmpR family regulator